MSAPARIVYRQLEIVRRAPEAGGAAPDPGVFDVVASSPTVDSYGTTLKPNWRLGRYQRNPVVLFAHDPTRPVGRAEHVRVEGDTLRATVRLAEPGTTVTVDEVRRLIAQEILRGVSVGFWPNQVTEERVEGVDVLALDDNELLEISLCSVPANPDALVDLRALLPAPAPRSAPTPTPTRTSTMATPAKKPAPPKKNAPKTRAPAPPQGERAKEDEEPAPGMVGGISDVHHKLYVEHMGRAVDAMPEDLSDEQRAACRAAVDEQLELARTATRGVTEGDDDGDDPPPPPPPSKNPTDPTPDEERGAPDTETLTRDLAAATARATRAEQRADGMERAEILRVARDAGKITPAMEADKDWQKDQADASIDQLRRRWRSAPVVVPRGRVAQPPKPSLGAGAAAAKGAPVDVGERTWKQLSNNEKAQLMRDDPETARALRAASTRP